MTSRENTPTSTQDDHAPEAGAEVVRGPSHAGETGGPGLASDDLATPAEAGAEPDPATPVIAEPDPATTAGGHDDPMVTVRMRVRRAPNFGRFIGVGFVLGLVLGVLFERYWPLIAGIEGASPYAPASEAAFFAAVFGLTGALLAALVAIVLDLRS